MELNLSLETCTNLWTKKKLE